VYSSQGVGPYVGIKTIKYSATKQGFKNATTEPTLSETYGELRYAKTPQGLYDGEKQVFTYYDYDDAELEASGFSGRSNVTFITIERRAYNNEQGYKWRLLTWTYDVGYRSSRSTAEQEISGGLKGSFTRHVTGRIWEWKKIHTLAVGAWQYTNLVFPIPS
jgi:hypothetical protein